MTQQQMMEMLYAGIEPAMTQCGFTADRPEGLPKGAAPVYERESQSVIDFKSEKGRARFVFNKDRVHLLFGALDAELSDDSAFTLDTTYLFVLEEYGEKDLRSLVNEISEYMTDTYLVKKKDIVKTKAPATVSKAAARSGAMAYDPITLATKFAGMFPELKDEIKININTYGEFLCEDFFVNHADKYIMDVIRSNNPQQMKKVFNILGEVYEDGTNEVQSLIAVTILGEIKNDPVIIQRIMPYLTDTMLEPVLAANERLAKSKSSQLRLQNPPKYKPKKQKKPGFLSQLMGGGQPGGGLQQ
ncbi:MAG: hypothetical protein IJK89_02320 [Clostridia bacterium]|nr:hypothetical protein [Clostridia bacterium]